LIMKSPRAPESRLSAVIASSMLGETSIKQVSQRRATRRAPG
jgi:hypothetical protein